MPESPRERAAELLRSATVQYHGKPVGTVAACGQSEDAVNYGQVFVRDFAVSAVAFLLRGEYEIVRHFLETVVDLQSSREHTDCFHPGQGLMPASFAAPAPEDEQVLKPDFGEHAIGRVTPVDSGFWWLWILRAYTRATGDTPFAASDKIQNAIRLILRLSLTTRFNMFPTMLVPDGAYTVDRRMGVYGYPLDIQALFFVGLRAAREMLSDEDELQGAVRERLGHLTFHLRTFYWLDVERLNEIYRYKVEQYGGNVLNKFNIQPESIPDWILNWLPPEGGYFIGNLGPGRIDFRCFMQGNLIAVLSALADGRQAEAIMNLTANRWDDLVGHMPMKLCWPALEGRDWQVLTGFDPKNRSWSYHNGGSWPFMLWLLSAAAVARGRPELGRRALEAAEARLAKDRWPEYYDGKRGQLVGREARLQQTWTAAGYLAAVELLDRQDKFDLLGFEEDPNVLACSERVAKEQQKMEAGPAING